MRGARLSGPALLRFRDALHTEILGLRQDSLFELVDAVLSAERPGLPARLSLQPVFRPRWPSTCDPLADGTLDADEWRRVCVSALPLPPSGRREPRMVDH